MKDILIAIKSLNIDVWTSTFTVVFFLSCWLDYANEIINVYSNEQIIDYANRFISLYINIYLYFGHASFNTN